jgi:drug/metabolite transporter (DMT)-like permease
MDKSTRAIAALAFTIFVWGISPAFIRSLVLDTGPADSLVIRMCTTAILSLPILPFTGFHIDKQDWPRLIFISCIGMFGYFLSSIFGFARVSAGIGSMVFATQPLVIALIAASFGIEKLTAAIIAGLIISFAGSIYLFSGDSANAVAGSATGGLILFAAGIAWALYVIFSKPLIQKYGTIKITAWSLVLCALPSLPFYTATTWPTLMALDASALFSLFFLSAISTLVAVASWNYAAGQLKASTVGATLYLVPVLAVAAGWLMLNEKASYATLLAGLVILAGVAVAEFGKSKEIA